MAGSSFVSFFIDPVLMAPTIGCMLMCLVASLVGVMVYLRKQVLIGETLSHSAYPGILLGSVLSGFITSNDGLQTIITLSGAFLSALIGLLIVNWMVGHLRIKSDSALCFILSTFFGVGLLIASEVQFSFTQLYKKALIYLYGQAATMTTVHIWIYGILCLIVVITTVLLYKEIQIVSFDASYAHSLGYSVRGIDFIIILLSTLAVVIGIRSVGVVLMSAMLVAPVVTARQFTNNLKTFFVLAGVFGVISGFLGNYFSVKIAEWSVFYDSSSRIILATGPMIVLVASLLCVLSLLFSPERGVIVRFFRALHFQYDCIVDNLLKSIWRRGVDKPISFGTLKEEQTISWMRLKLILRGMIRNGWITLTSENHYILTNEGKARAEKIIRLHRLWELYLVSYLGAGSERVHRNAEEMEHILTPEIENELTLLLKDPQIDPHDQPIPPRRNL